MNSDLLTPEKNGLKFAFTIVDHLTFEPKNDPRFGQWLATYNPENEYH